MSASRVNGNTTQARAIALIGCELIGYRVSRDPLCLIRLLALAEMANLLGIMSEKDHALVMSVINEGSAQACSPANSVLEVQHG